MSELIVIGYDDHAKATSAYNEVMSLQGDFVVELQGLAIVTVDEDGKSHVETPQKIVGMSAASGALWGMLLGLLFFVPFFGLALGGLMGALFGKLGKSGINDEFRSQVNALLEPGKAAVVIMASKITEDKFADRMKPFGGTLLKTSLSEEDEKELAHELGDAPVVSPVPTASQEPRVGPAALDFRSVSPDHCRCPVPGSRLLGQPRPPGNPGSNPSIRARSTAPVRDETPSLW